MKHARTQIPISLHDHGMSLRPAPGAASKGIRRDGNFKAPARVAAKSAQQSFECHALKVPGHPLTQGSGQALFTASPPRATRHDHQGISGRPHEVNDSAAQATRVTRPENRA